MARLIENNVVRPDTMVWQEGMPDWAMAKLTNLADCFSGRSYSGASSKPFVNDSGSGSSATLPDDLKGYNRGAVALPWF